MIFFRRRKKYIVFAYLWGEIEGGATHIYGVYVTKSEAMQAVNELILEDKNDNYQIYSIREGKIIFDKDLTAN